MMLKALQAWLNGTREYNMGVSLFKACNIDDKLAKTFQEGYSLWNNFKLQEELKKECRRLKSVEKASVIMDTSVAVVKSVSMDPESPEILAIEKTIEGIKAAMHNPNAELQQAVKSEADMLYKEAMNARGALFASIPDLEVVEGNRPEQIEFRQPLALEAVKKYIAASIAYDRLDYVRIHGRLEENETNDNIEEEVPDHQVKPALDNARKARNKLLGRPQTPERIARIQEHNANIEKLEARWRCLHSQSKAQNPN